jgi:hypothetical protein
MEIHPEPDCAMNSKELEKTRKAELKAAMKHSGLDRKAFKAMFQMDGLGGHELLDRSFLLSTMVDDFVLSHPSALLNAELYEQASKASRSLAKLYQMVGEAVSKK